MEKWRENPDSEECLAADLDNRRAVFAAEMSHETSKNCLKNPAMVFNRAVRVLVSEADNILEANSQLNRSIQFYQYQLNQIEIHLRGVVSGKFDGNEIAKFLLNEFFTKK